jgi:hypothetical protein
VFHPQFWSPRGKLSCFAPESKHETTSEQPALSLKGLAIKFERRFNGTNLGFEVIASFCIAFFTDLRVQEIAPLLQALNVRSNSHIHGKYLSGYRDLAVVPILINFPLHGVNRDSG